ncbi:MAG: TetR/AcrR family transcriptional regulator [Egibacteraceae bacterium]
MPSLWADSLDEHRELVRSRLLDAFGELVAQHGVDGVTLSSVAERAGIARSAIYNYVKDKHDLMLAYADRVVGSTVAEIRAVMASADPAERLRGYVAINFRAMTTDRAVGHDLLPLLSPEEQARLLAHLAPVRELLAEIIADGVAQGVFVGDPEALHRAAWALLSGYRTMLIRDEVDLDEAIATASSVLLRGLSGQVV